VSFSPAQIHAQNHVCPVLRFGTTRTGLDIEIGVIAVHFAGKHAAKLQGSKLCLKGRDVSLDLTDRIGIVFIDRKCQQLVCVAQAAGQLVQYDNYLLQLRALLAKCLGSFGFVPDIGLFEFALNFGQAFRLAVVVTDTPSTQRCVQRDRLWFV
jgi:hypothetical protein